MDEVGKPRVVADAGPLIYLALLDRFHLLHDLFDEVGELIQHNFWIAPNLYERLTGSRP